MTNPKHDLAGKHARPRLFKTPYVTPRLEALGSLRSSTRGSGGKGADGAMGMTMMSDRRAKRDMVRVGQHPLGFGIYVFRYKTPYDLEYGASRRIGVMADEVARVCPQAVRHHADGYQRVNYGRLFG
jgi:hypothetical protein